jgi:hypothetical protein
MWKKIMIFCGMKGVAKMGVYVEKNQAVKHSPF